MNRSLAPSISQVDPLGHCNGWSTVKPSATSRVSTCSITSPWVHHRVLQPKVFEQRQDPSELGVHAERHLRFDAQAASAGKRLQGLAAAEGGAGQDPPDGVVLEADHQPGGFGLAGQREGP